MSTSVDSTRKRSITRASKASGVEWLGEVPAHWEVKPLKFVAKTIMGQSPSSDAYTMDRSGTPFLQGNAEFGAKHPSPKHFCEVAFKIAPIGSLLVSVRAPVGALNIADRKYGIGRGLCAVVADNTSLLPEFAWHALTVTRHELWSIATGSTYEAVSADEVAKMTLLVPPLDEQRAIARYLDRETARIDALIEKKQRQIELLHEKRAALISHAVTKGLHSNASMKESGFSCIGAIPAHWTVCRLMFLTPPHRQIMYGIVLPGPHVEEGIPIVKAGNVAPGKLRHELLKCTTPEIEAGFARARLRTDDLVFAIRGSIGSVEIVPAGVSGSNITQDVARVAPRTGVDPTWLLYALESSPTQEQVAAATLGATVKGLNIFELKRLYVPVPPPEEQQQLGRWIRDHVERIAGMVERVETSIDCLREYRTALISAAVTGKVDVRQKVT